MNKHLISLDPWDKTSPAHDWLANTDPDFLVGRSSLGMSEYFTGRPLIYIYDAIIERFCKPKETSIRREEGFPPREDQEGSHISARDPLPYTGRANGSGHCY